MRFQQGTKRGQYTFSMYAFNGLTSYGTQGVSENLVWQCFSMPRIFTKPKAAYGCLRITPNTAN